MGRIMVGNEVVLRGEIKAFHKKTSKMQTHMCNGHMTWISARFVLENGANERIKTRWL